MTILLKPKEQVNTKKKIKMEHKREIPITLEIKEFYNKFLEMYNIEENDNKGSAQLRKSQEVSHDFKEYINLIQTEPSVVPVIPAIVDFIYNKWIDYISAKHVADAKML